MAALLESLMQIAGGIGGAGPAAVNSGRRATVLTGPRDPAMRRARVCYDHIAGRLGVAVAERLQGDGSVIVDGETARVAPQAARSLAALGIDLTAAAPVAGGAGRRRPACRPCLDWSERSCSLAGALGALISAHCLEGRWLVRREGSRALDVTAAGQVALRGWLGAAAWDRVAGRPALVQDPVSPPASP